MWQETQAICRNTPNRPMSHFRGGQSIRKTFISCGTFTYYSGCVFRWQAVLAATGIFVRSVEND